MSKILIFWCVVLGLMLFTVLSYAQTTTIILDAEGNYKGQLITIPPIPQWR
jgi:hypothetical protein